VHFTGAQMSFAALFLQLSWEKGVQPRAQQLDAVSSQQHSVNNYDTQYRIKAAVSSYNVRESGRLLGGRCDGQ
jgi:hypothetical protein